MGAASAFVAVWRWSIKAIKDVAVCVCWFVQ